MAGGAGHRLTRSLIGVPVVAVMAGGLVAGCGGDDKPVECATIAKAVVAYGDLQDGARAGTVTDADAAGFLKTVHDQLGVVAGGSSDSQISADAAAASDTAGRLRAALVNGDRAAVRAGTGRLAEEMDAVSAPCVQ